MAFNLKYAIGASVFWPPADRVVSTGYKSQLNEENIFRTIKSVKGADGVELYYPYDFNDVKKMKKILNDEGLLVSAVGPGIWADKRWQQGSITSYDKNIRNEALDLSKRVMDMASELGVKNFAFWPAHDGYDYYFQTDYQRKWDMMVESIKEIASMNTDINVCVEYKAKEPRTHQIIASALKVLKLSEDVRAGKGPVLLEAITYRIRGHSLRDAQRYRPEGEAKKWLTDYCPIERFKKYLIKAGYITQPEIDNITMKVNEEIDAAVKFALESPFLDVSKVAEDIYA
ncbi:MAG: TIM barrel protein [Actinobacteria bacterium]|nr:TIM barrel protein [Actinomycetota bacterium]